MDGVTVLNSYMTNGIPVAILLFIGAVLIFVCCVRDFAKDENACGVLLLILSLVISGFGVFLWFVPSRTCYEVIINDDVTLKEFQERYKIVDQRGDIYVVEERADVNG